MAPPQLAGDAPVLDVFHPVAVAVFEFGWVELDGVVHHMVEGGLGQLFHGDEPLHGEARLDDGAGALGAAHLVGVVLDLDQVAGRIEGRGEGLAGLEPVLSSNSPPTALTVPSGLSMSMTSRLCFWPSSWSFGSWAGSP